MSTFRTNINGVDLDVEYLYTPAILSDYDTPPEPCYVDLLAIMVADSEVDILDVINPAILDTIKQEISEYYE